MRFDPQANFVSRPRTVTVAPIMARPPSVGARSPVKTAVVIVVIGFVAGIAMWLWTEGLPGRPAAAADAASATPVDSAVVQYAEAVMKGKTEEDRVAAVTGSTIEERLAGRTRGAGGPRAQDEFHSGQMAMGMGKNKEAVTHFLAAIKIDPDYADAHYRLGVAYLRLGDLAGARREQAYLRQRHDERANLLGHLVDN